MGGIRYANGTNTGFLPVEGVTVTGGSAPTVTGKMYIGSATVPDLTQDESGTGWAWDADDATLTLTDNIAGILYFPAAAATLQ